MYRKLVFVVFAMILAEYSSMGQVFFGLGYEQIRYQGDFYGNHTLPAFNVQSSYERQLPGVFLYGFAAGLSLGTSTNHLQTAFGPNNDLIVERKGRWSEAHLRIPIFGGLNVPISDEYNALVEVGPELDLCFFDKFSNSTSVLNNPFDCKYNLLNLYLDGTFGLEINNVFRVSCGLSWAPFPFSKEYIYVYGTKYSSTAQPIFFHVGISIKICE